MKNKGIDLLRSYLSIALGVLLAGFGLESFLIPNGYIDGGITGISLLTNIKTGFNFSILLILFNIPFILLAFRNIGKIFAFRSIVAITTLAFVVRFVHYPIITDDALLIAIFGGFFLGSGIGFAMRGNAVLDGTEVLAIYLSRKIRTSVGNVILMFNILIFLAAAYLLNAETAMYAILTYFVASRAITFILEGLEECTGVSIITNKTEELRKVITEKLRLGVTIYKATSGYGETKDQLKDIDVIYTVVTRLEIARLQDEIQSIDPDAFVIMNTIVDTHGGVIRRSERIH